MTRPPDTPRTRCAEGGEAALEQWRRAFAALRDARAACCARDILADDPGLFDRTTALAVDAIGRTRPELLRLTPVPRPITRNHRRPTGKRLLDPYGAVRKSHGQMVVDRDRVREALADRNDNTDTDTAEIDGE
ncbi:hypothetical protein SAMN05216223_103539 [Actinacidiphila yanglinensis]|uniref:Uncharacterized protein n=1 Tax=Actinacidiphila yanglinensis TaxID=310779 RepID=A0A1H5Y326_9ACTN|nr:hypothetical protein [Actinacidiphila yanglinensis]SEG18459.1 hypothetical protein SAMN05216223_103539 [Actinacidiphila yanglinensis]